MPDTRAFLFSIAALCAGAATSAHASDSLDTSWNGSGTLVTGVPSFDIGASAMTMQPDGRILIAYDRRRPAYPPSAAWVFFGRFARTSSYERRTNPASSSCVKRSGSITLTQNARAM